MIEEPIVKIVNEDLTYDKPTPSWTKSMSGETTATQNAAFLAAWPRAPSARRSTRSPAAHHHALPHTMHTAAGRLRLWVSCGMSLWWCPFGFPLRTVFTMCKGSKSPRKNNGRGLNNRAQAVIPSIFIPTGGRCHHREVRIPSACGSAFVVFFVRIRCPLQFEPDASAGNPPADAYGHSA